MFKGLFSQLLIIAVSIGIILTYVKPTFAEIATLQDDMAVYQEERKKVAFVNQQLSKLMADINLVSVEDREALQTYMPDPADIDVISIPRDLEFMTQSANAVFIQANVATAEDDSYAQDDNEQLIPYSFNFSFYGSYDEVKAVLAALEQNHYPLEIHSMDVSTDDQGATLQVEMTLVTYAYQSSNE